MSNTTYRLKAYTWYCGLHRHPLLWCQQHVVQRLGTEPSRLLDHAHGTVYLDVCHLLLVTSHPQEIPQDLFI